MLASLASAVDAAHLTNWEIVSRLGVGLGLGAAIGVQREFDGQDAGVRTHALLAMGSAMFGVLSVGAFSEFVGTAGGSNVQVDVGRIASYVVAGVGFLAGGTIVKQRDRVRGLTTAGSLWVTAAIGLAAGLGLLLGATIAAVATVVVLVSEGPLARLFRRSGKAVKDSTGTVHAIVDEEIDLARLFAEFAPPGIKRRSVTRTVLSTGGTALAITSIPVSSRAEILARIESGATVREISWTDD